MALGAAFEGFAEGEIDSASVSAAGPTYDQSEKSASQLHRPHPLRPPQRATGPPARPCPSAARRTAA